MVIGFCKNAYLTDADDYTLTRKEALQTQIRELLTKQTGKVRKILGEKYMVKEYE